MNSVIRFLIFILYSTCIFFLPNNELILSFIVVNLILTILLKVNAKKVINSMKKILPFIIFTLLINCILDDWKNAIYIGIKLLIVCNITIIYANTTSITEISETIKSLCTPLKIFNVNVEDIGLLVSISLSMLPILKKEIYELKDACRAKNINFNLKNSKYVLSKFFISLIMKINQIEDSLISRGYN